MENTSVSGKLSDEQQKRIAENRKRALEIRAARQQSQQVVDSGPKTHSFQNNLSSTVNHSRNQGKTTHNSHFKNSNVTSTSLQNFYQSSHNNRPTNISIGYKPKNNRNLPDKEFANKDVPFNEHKTGNFVAASKVIKGKFVLISRRKFQLDIAYHQQCIDICKTIPSKMYDPKDKKWSFSITDHDRLSQALSALQPSVIITPLPKIVLKTFLNAPTQQTTPEIDISSRVDPVLSDALMPFQRIGVSFGIQKKGRVLIADDMGLGKTIQAMGIAAYYRDEWPLLIVSPSSVKYTWAAAFHSWIPTLDPQSINVINAGKDMIGNDKVVIIGYNLMTKKTEELAKHGFQVIIMDESHHLKNLNAARTKSAIALMKEAKRLILLSGTPALSRPLELFSQVNVLVPKLFPSFYDFGSRYCDGKQMPWGWDFSGASHTQELLLLLEETVMIRRLKKDVIQELPPKIRQLIVLNPSSVKTSAKVMMHFSSEMKREHMKTMEKRGTLLQYYAETGKAKLSSICDYISELLENEQKFICFAHHKDVVSGICETLSKKKCQYIRIDGTTSSEERKYLCDKFQLNDSYRVAVLSITAASVGITLTAAQLVVFAELFWNPGILTQAEDRAHRIGQSDSVLIQYLVAKNTADDYLWVMVKHKLDVLNGIGLSKDDFSDADTKTLMSPEQKVMDNFLSKENEEIFKSLLEDSEVPEDLPKKAKMSEDM